MKKLKKLLSKKPTAPIPIFQQEVAIPLTTKIQQQLIELGRDTFNYEVKKSSLIEDEAKKQALIESIKSTAARLEAEQRVTKPIEPSKQETTK